ncbi:MAG: polysaccharide lyase family 1 protein [Limisphaerales bacterium]
MKFPVFAPSVSACVWCALAVSHPVAAEMVSTARIGGADLEFREALDTNNVFSQGTVNGAALNARTSAAGDRNEVIGLKFDLSGYSLPALTNVALKLYAYRLDTSTRQVSLYGVAPGTFSGTGTFTTDTWNESATLYGDLPGLLASDGNPATQNLNSNALTLLQTRAISGGQPEGTLHVFDAPALTDFLRSYGGGPQVTLLLAAANTSSGQFRVASREATQTETGALTGNAGDFAPFLSFDVVGGAGLPGPIITNTALVPGGIVLSGEGGPPQGQFHVLAADNLAVPSANWPAQSTNTFDSAGGFRVTNALPPGDSARFFRLLALPAPAPLPDFSLIGFATLNGGTTGGAGGLTQTVSTASALTSAAGATGPRVIQVQGTIVLNNGLGTLNVQSHKTLVGLGTNAGIVGQIQISGRTNVIVRNLTISNNGAPGQLDGVRIVNGSRNIWVDHCTFVDCSDGALDITVASDFVTVSWCKFLYVNQTEHRFANLIAASDTDAGNYRITFHHNWWSTGCDQRMPMSRHGTVHLFNNFWNAPGNSYCSNARTNAQFLSENNFYLNVRSPLYKESTGRIRATGNLYQGITGIAPDPGTNTLDAVLTPPPYPYTLRPAAAVPGVVTNFAGAGRGPFAP